MYRLYHYPLCPFSRKVRILLAEKRIPFTLIQEDFWKRRTNFIKLNPFCSTPLLTSKPNVIVPCSNAIVEYIEEKFPNNSLLDGNPEQRAEIRKITNWFDEKFFYEVVRHVLYEKAINFFKLGSEPDVELLKIARNNLPYHMEYITFLLSYKRWLAGDRMSVADVAAAAHISVLDYFNEINWSSYQDVKDWYSVVKSRPSFKEILKDVISGFIPPSHYKQLDF